MVLRVLGTGFLSVFVQIVLFEYYHEVTAEIVPGHGIASGKKIDDRFPNGTISLQIPIFKSLGLNLDHFHQGTLNLKISPFGHELRKPSHFFSNVDWSIHLPPENFSFYPCLLEDVRRENNKSYQGLVYWPHPSTKPEFHQSDNVLEVIAPFIPNICYGNLIKFCALNQSFRFFRAT